MSDRAAILDQLTENHVIAAGWAEALRSVDPEIDRRIDACLTRLATAGPYLPARANLWRAFEVPLKDVRVLILGQDPYPNPQHAVGLSFSTGPQGPIPASLHNIYRNLEQCGYPPPADGDLSAWTEQGVMLLNRALTVPLNVTARPRRHLRWWAPVIIPTMKAIAVEAAERPVAALLWGQQHTACATTSSPASRSSLRATPRRNQSIAELGQRDRSATPAPVPT